MHTFKCIIWGTGIVYDTYINSVRYQELMGNIKITGITSNQALYQQVDGYNFIAKEDLGNVEFDLIIVASISSFNEILKDAVALGINADKIISIKVFSLSNFDIHKYIELKNSKLSIFSHYCWGGFTYHRLGMEFLSPFINMFESVPDYLKILNDPMNYLNHELKLAEYAYEKTLKIQYPVCYLNDVKLYFNHYTSYEEAVNKWNYRKNKINWDNLFVMMTTTEPDEANKFLELPYEKKVCFVPFETSEKSLISINHMNNNELKDKPFWNIVLGMATGDYRHYDQVELLLGNVNENRISII